MSRLRSKTSLLTTATRAVSIPTDICVSRKGNFGHKTYHLQSIYKSYSFIYNSNTLTEKYQANFATTTSKGYETIMILPKPAG